MDVDEVGRLLFGRPCRLALAVWIVRQSKPSFYQSEPPREVIHQSASAAELKRLVKLGMLEELRPDDSRRIYYVRTSSQLWRIIQTAADVIDPVEPPAAAGLATAPAVDGTLPEGQGCDHDP